MSQRKILLDKSVPNCYNMYMKKRWNVSKELERIHNKPKDNVPWQVNFTTPLDMDTSGDTSKYGMHDRRNWLIIAIVLFN